MANPDGYTYSLQTDQRFWRKNRKPNAGSSCVGTGASQTANRANHNNGAYSNNILLSSSRKDPRWP